MKKIIDNTFFKILIVLFKLKYWIDKFYYWLTGKDPKEYRPDESGLVVIAGIRKPGEKEADIRVLMDNLSERHLKEIAIAVGGRALAMEQLKKKNEENKKNVQQEKTTLQKES